MVENEREFVSRVEAQPVQGPTNTPDHVDLEYVLQHQQVNAVYAMS